MKNGQGRFQ